MQYVDELWHENTSGQSSDHSTRKQRASIRHYIKVRGWTKTALQKKYGTRTIAVINNVLENSDSDRIEFDNYFIDDPVIESLDQEQLCEYGRRIDDLQCREREKKLRRKEAFVLECALVMELAIRNKLIERARDVTEGEEAISRSSSPVRVRCLTSTEPSYCLYQEWLLHHQNRSTAAVALMKQLYNEENQWDLKRLEGRRGFSTREQRAAIRYYHTVKGRRISKLAGEFKWSVGIINNILENKQEDLLEVDAYFLREPLLEYLNNDQKSEYERYERRIDDIKPGLSELISMKCALVVEFGKRHGFINHSRNTPPRTCSNDGAREEASQSSDSVESSESNSEQPQSTSSSEANRDHETLKMTGLTIRELGPNDEKVRPQNGAPSIESAAELPENNAGRSPLGVEASTPNLNPNSCAGDGNFSATIKTEPDTSATLKKPNSTAQDQGHVGRKSSEIDRVARRKEQASSSLSSPRKTVVVVFDSDEEVDKPETTKIIQSSTNAAKCAGAEVVAIQNRRKRSLEMVKQEETMNASNSAPSQSSDANASDETPIAVSKRQPLRPVHESSTGEQDKTDDSESPKKIARMERMTRCKEGDRNATLSSPRKAAIWEDQNATPLKSFAPIQSRSAGQRTANAEGTSFQTNDSSSSRCREEPLRQPAPSENMPTSAEMQEHENYMRTFLSQLRRDLSAHTEEFHNAGVRHADDLAIIADHSEERAARWLREHTTLTAFELFIFLSAIYP